MKNLHLMFMKSNFCINVATELNRNFDNATNEFVFKAYSDIVEKFENCTVNPNAFSPEAINENHKSYDHIVLHSLYLTGDEILRLSDEAAEKIIWCVWGHDLYSAYSVKPPFSIKRVGKETLDFLFPFAKNILQLHKEKKKIIAEKVRKFNAVAVGYEYDKNMIYEKYGKEVTVKTAAYFPSFTLKDLDEVKDNMKHDDSVFNVIIGHCGYYFIRHEKYLKKLARYKNENIHINLVLAYYSSEERVEKIKALALEIFGEEKCTFITEMMPQKNYFEFLGTMDAAVFPYTHQSGLFNTWALAYLGKKLYFHPRGVLYKGFKEAGLKVYDCRRIGRTSYKKFCENNYTEVDDRSPIFDPFDYDKNISRWKALLY